MASGGASIFMQILDMAPDNAEAAAGLLRGLVMAGRLDEAQGVLDQLAPEMAGDAHIERARAALELARAKPADAELENLRKAAAERPADMDAQFAFASAAFASGERDAAADTLLAMIRADREWNEGAAKAKLLQIFEVVGLEDPWATTTRRKLSTILFG
ncbi:tetratricopeptide repeat protein [Novosphingobium colocasiae]